MTREAPGTRTPRKTARTDGGSRPRRTGAMDPRGGTSRSAAAPAAKAPDTWSRVYAIVRKIPRGRVASYGQVAVLAGLPRQARLVGYALHALMPGTNVPWQRVINSQGRISLPIGGNGGGALQARLLRREGVTVSPSGKIDLDRFGWRAGRARE